MLGNDSHKNGFAAHVKQQRVQTFFADAAGKGGGVGSIERFGQKPGIEQRKKGFFFTRADGDKFCRRSLDSRAGQDNADQAAVEFRDATHNVECSMPFGREQRLMFMRRKECKPPANLTRSEIGVGADPHRALGIAKGACPSAAFGGDQLGGDGGSFLFLSCVLAHAAPPREEKCI